MEQREGISVCKLYSEGMEVIINLIIMWYGNQTRSTVIVTLVKPKL